MARGSLDRVLITNGRALGRYLSVLVVAVGACTRVQGEEVERYDQIERLDYLNF